MLLLVSCDQEAFREFVLTRIEFATFASIAPAEREKWSGELSEEAIAARAQIIDGKLALSYLDGDYTAAVKVILNNSHNIVYDVSVSGSDAGLLTATAHQEEDDPSVIYLSINVTGG